MALQVKNILLKIIRSRLVITSLFLFYFGQILSSQEGERIFSFINQSAREIISTIEGETAYTFSYILEELPRDRYTFTVSHDKEEIAQFLTSIFNRKITLVADQNIIISAKSAQTATSTPSVPELSFQILDSEDLLPIIGANVLIPSTNSGSASDTEGNVTLSGYFSKYDKVLIKYLGYKTEEVSISQLADGMTIRLTPQEHVLDDIVIRTVRKTIVNSYLEDKIDLNHISLPSSADNDVFTVAQMVPGVYNSGESLQDMQIRGGPPDQVSFNWNNIRLFNNSLFYGRVSAVNPFMVDQINITRNGASADEDASASGAVNLNTKLSTNVKNRIKFHTNALYANAGVDLVLFDQKLKIRAAARQSYSPKFKTPIYDKYFGNTFQTGKLPDIEYYYELFEILDETTRVPELSFGDKSISIQYTPTKNTTIDFNIIDLGNKFIYKIYKDYSSEIPYDSLSQHTQGLNLSWQQKYSKSIQSNITASKSTYENGYISQDDINISSSPYLSQENRISQTNIQTDISYTSKIIDLNLGYEYSAWDVIYQAFATRENETWYNSEELGNGYENSFFINTSLHPKPWYEIVLGLRHSTFNKSLFGRKMVEPRLHFSLLPSQDIVLHAHYGKFHQNLNRRSLTNPLSVDNGYWLLSDERVGDNSFIFIVQSQQLSTGIKYTPSDWTITLDVYQKEANNVWTSAFDFSSTEDPYEFTNLDIKGMEASIQLQKINWSTLITYNYVDDQITTLNSEITIPSPYTQPHRFTAQGQYKWKEWNISSQVTFASGRYFSIPTQLNENIKNGEIEYVAQFDQYFSSQVDNYIRCDMGIKYNIPLKNTKKAIIGLQFMNILNRDNVIKNEYFVSYRSTPPEIDVYSRKGLPFVWNFSFDIWL